MRKFIDLTGQRFGKWAVVCLTDKRTNCATRFLCRCDCGTEKKVCSHHLRSGESTNCGCSRKTSMTPEQLRARRIEWQRLRRSTLRASKPTPEPKTTKTKRGKNEAPFGIFEMIERVERLRKLRDSLLGDVAVLSDRYL